MFIDEAKITVKAGNGGHGCIAFRREKFVPRGGPSGGDGGDGGHIYLVGDSQENTLLKFRFKHIFRAGRGQHGQGSNKRGRNGEDLDVTVPMGTIVYDDSTGEVLHDFTEPKERVLIAAGGRGGHGNAHFASSTNRAPQRAQDGLPGEEKTLEMMNTREHAKGSTGHLSVESNDQLSGLYAEFLGVRFIRSAER